MAKRFKNEDNLDKDKKVTKEGFKQTLQIFRFIYPYRLYFITGLVFLLFSSLMAMVFPFITGRLVDSALGLVEGWLSDRNIIAAVLVGILVIQGIFSFCRIMLFANVTERAMRDLRYSLYSKLMSLGIPFFENRRVGELTSRITSDVTQLQDVLSTTLAEFIRQIIILLIGITIITITSPQLTLVMLCSIPVLIIAAMLFGKFIRKLSKKVQDDLASANTVAEETLQSINVVKSFTNEQYEAGRYNIALQQVVQNALKAAKFRGVFASFVIFAIFGGIVLVIWYGLGLIEEKQMTIGDLISFIIYTSFIAGSVGSMGELYGQLQRTMGASERVLEILGEKEEVDMQLDIAKATRAIQGDITFSNVSFFYPTRPDMAVLKDISLNVAAGQKVALVGHSGAGKSTIVQLLLRFYNHQSGQITIDHQDINAYNVTALRRNIGVVPQEVILFGGTIRENIAYGKPGASEEEIIAAAQKANALEFINSFPEGLSTVVGERGVKLSGGQRQRIAIARAILKDPAILILDEATSSLDAESERLVQEALDELMKNRTTVIIAHRLATIRMVDKIYVLKEGYIIESGTHNELVNIDNGLYSNLVKLQFETTE
jgi:ATP-binding cassette subfamily B protein